VLGTPARIVAQIRRALEIDVSVGPRFGDDPHADLVRSAGR
jgi:hypothetical protein